MRGTFLAERVVQGEQIGRFATEVEVAGLKDDPVDPKNYERLMETLRNYRVEAKTAAKLVKKNAARDR